MPSKVFRYTVHVYNKGHIFVEPEELNKYNLSTFRSPHQRPSGLTTQSSYGDENDVYRKYSFSILPQYHFRLSYDWF